MGNILGLAFVSQHNSLEIHPSCLCVSYNSLLFYYCSVIFCGMDVLVCLVFPLLEDMQFLAFKLL